MKSMKHVILIAALGLASPALAQEQTPDDPSLLERGAQMLLQGLLREMEPALEDLQGLAEEFGPALQDFTAQMGPALRGLLEEVDDWSVYDPPEVLENGDIIIRRKAPATKETPPPPDTTGSIEL